MLQVNLHPFPVLQTARLTLRQLNFDDAEALFTLRTDPQVLKYIDINQPKTLDDVHNWIKMIHGIHEKNDGVMWAISSHGSSEMLGSIGFFNMAKENHRAEVGYMLSPARQGQGFMQEAMDEAIKYAFEEIDLHSIEAHVKPANQASINVLERSGFVREAYFKENYYQDGRFHDSAIYCLITNKQ